MDNDIRVGTHGDTDGKALAGKAELKATFPATDAALKIVPINTPHPTARIRPIFVRKSVDRRLARPN
jgi:hypothetical protein